MPHSLVDLRVKVPSSSLWSERTCSQIQGVYREVKSEGDEANFQPEAKANRRWLVRRVTGHQYREAQASDIKTLTSDYGRDGRKVY